MRNLTSVPLTPRSPIKIVLKFFTTNIHKKRLISPNFKAVESDDLLKEYLPRLFDVLSYDNVGVSVSMDAGDLINVWQDISDLRR